MLSSHCGKFARLEHTAAELLEAALVLINRLAQFAEPVPAERSGE